MRITSESNMVICTNINIGIIHGNKLFFIIPQKIKKDVKWSINNRNIILKIT
jgi:hypothetical protein